MIRNLEVLYCPAGWRTWAFLKATTDDLIGWAEITESNGSLGAIVGAIEDLKPLVVGRTPEWETVTRDLYRTTRQSAGGAVAKAIGGIQNCLLDIKGKELGVPVYELFGGPTRWSIPAYWSHCGTTRARAWQDVGKPELRSYDDVEKLGEEVSKAGFSALKTNVVIPGDGVRHPGFGGRGTVDSEDIVKLVAAFKRGGDADVIVDLNYNVTPKQAVRIADLDLLWVEVDGEPEDIKWIKDHSKVPICSGENVMLADYKRYVGCMDIASVDAVWNGVGNAVKIANMVPVVTPHNYYSHLATFISAHFCASVTNANMFEVDVDDVPWKDNIVTSVPHFSFGCLQMPTGPGWGCDVNERELNSMSGAPIRP